VEIVLNKYALQKHRFCFYLKNLNACSFCMYVCHIWIQVALDIKRNFSNNGGILAIKRI